MHKYDLLIVGSGLTGATIARLAHEKGLDVCVLERRSVLGGNVRDEVHKASGIRYNLYGPHYFRTSSERIWTFVNSFAEFKRFEAKVQIKSGNDFIQWPLVQTWDDMPEQEDQTFENFEEICLSKMPKYVYEKYIGPYTHKQWGVAPSSLSPDLASRIEIRKNFNDTRLKTDRFQGVPVDGYSHLIERLLKGIETHTCVDYLIDPSTWSAKITVFTGSIDEFYGFKFGHLRYRAQSRTHSPIYRSQPDYVLPCVQVNRADEWFSAIRMIEWKHIWPGTDPNISLITHEIPFTPLNPDQYEYPFPSQIDRDLYLKYLSKPSPVLFAGRLGEYRYLDMDQAIARAFVHFDRSIFPAFA